MILTAFKNKNVIKPKRVEKKAHIRIVALARSMGRLSPGVKEAALKRLQEFGFHLSFGEHVDEMNEFRSSSIESRISDLHDAFADDSVDAILTVIGGYNSNQLLDYIDYNFIASHPKILCGFSDISVIGNAITAKTGMITYTGPHFSSWAMKYGFEYSMEYFNKCCMTHEAFDLLPSQDWSDDLWYLDQEKREFIVNERYWVLNDGYASGRTAGGNAGCLNVLQGTAYWPGLDDTILLLEGDAEISPELFDRQLQSLIHQPDFRGTKGILIGRFQKESKMSRSLLEKIIFGKNELRDIPIVANVNFGHTTPIATLPIGGSLELLAENGFAGIRIIEH